MDGTDPTEIPSSQTLGYSATGLAVAVAQKVNRLKSVPGDATGRRAISSLLTAPQKRASLPYCGHGVPASGICLLEPPACRSIAKASSPSTPITKSLIFLFRDVEHMAHNVVKRGRLFHPEFISRFRTTSGREECGLARQIVGEDDASGGRGVQVIARAANILRVLEERPEGLILAEIARKVDLARSTVQRILTALAAEDFVIEAQPGRGTRIGPGVARIAARW